MSQNWPEDRSMSPTPTARLFKLSPDLWAKLEAIAAAKALGLEAPVIDQKPASVTVKLLA